MDQKRKKRMDSYEISKLYEWELGGYQQKVLIEGEKSEFPVVLTLHGGPGTPIPFSVGCRGLFPEFTSRYIMVYWDQLGCGINNYVIDDSFKIDSFVAMAEDLICKIKELLPNNKLYIFAMSWGTVLAAKILAKSGCAVDGVIAWGQIVKELFFNQEVLNALEGSNIPKRKLAIIQNAKIENISPKELQLVSSSIRKYTNGYENKNGEQAPIGRIIKGLLTSPDYKFRDFKAMMINGYQKNRSLWDELVVLDLSEELKNVRVPYLIFQGDTDIVSSTKTVKELVDGSNNPNLNCEIVTDSGHIPGKVGMDSVFEALNTLERGEAMTASCTDKTHPAR